MMTHEDFTKKLLRNPEVKKQYKFLENEFVFFDELLKARINAGLTQADVAIRMGTNPTTSLSKLDHNTWIPNVVSIQHTVF